ncbi:MAG TPA: M15 family metallopeptidase [Rhizomicrobium sp.]|nr:M15 family metallopeptidase [Rhizomicrobium sp.]
MDRRTFLASSLAAVLPVPSGLKKLVAAYSDRLSQAQDNALVWRDGTRMAWSDGRAKSFDEKLAHPDLSDQLSIAYAPGPIAAAPSVNQDPGRIRYQPFFEKMYGASEAQVRANLVPVRWAPAAKDFLVTRVNGIDRLLAEIGKEIANMPDSVARFARAPAGSFNYRDVAGTRAKSGHAFGIAFDIDSRLSRYWRWDRPMRWRGEVPYALVEAFERRKFIWGGKWYHYDTMHFEYRPELF